MALRAKDYAGHRVVVECDDGEAPEGWLVASCLNGESDPKRPTDPVTLLLDPGDAPYVRERARPVALGRVRAIRLAALPGPMVSAAPPDTFGPED